MGLKLSEEFNSLYDIITTRNRAAVEMHDGSNGQHHKAVAMGDKNLLTSRMTLGIVASSHNVPSFF